MHCAKLLSKVCGEQHLKALVCAHDEAHIFLNLLTLFSCIWHVISLTCKMTHDQLANCMQKSMENHEYGAYEFQVKIELYCIYPKNFRAEIFKD